jgi:hypothetical protein
MTTYQALLSVANLGWYRRGRKLENQITRERAIEDEECKVHWRLIRYACRLIAA